MKKITLISALCLLTTILSFCQTTYPKKLVIDNDTVVVITPIQLKGINQLLVDRKILKETLSDVQIRFKMLQNDILSMNKLSENKSQLISLQKKQIEDLTSLNGYSDQNITLLKQQLKDEKKKKVKFTVIGISTTALITTTIVSLLK